MTTNTEREPFVDAVEAGKFLLSFAKMLSSLNAI